LTDYSIRTDFLSEEDARRVYEQNTLVRASYEDYCPTCATTGSYRYNGTDHECDCQYQLQLHKHYLNSGIEVPYQILDWDDFAVTNSSKESALQSVRYYLSSEQLIRRGLGVLFIGPHSTGKTLLANLIIKDLIKRGYRCYATTVFAVKEAFTAGWSSDEDKRWFDRKFKYSQALLLDDMGREQRNTLSQNTIEGILRSRVQGGRPTFITTNLSLDEMEIYGTGIQSLLRRQFLVIEVDGPEFGNRHAQQMVEENDRGETRPIV